MLQDDSELPSPLATQHDELPIWARPLARAPDDMGENMGVRDTSSCTT